MPYEIVDDHSECSGYAVVKEGTDELLGCHDTVGEAEDQLAALYAAEGKKLPWGEEPATHRRTLDETTRDIARVYRHRE